MEDIFKEFGLTQKEARAFLKMLPLGPQPASVFAKQIGIPRSSMYVILERLKALHLAEEWQERGMTYFQAVSVRSLPDILRRKERRIEQSLELLERTLPQLESIERKLSIAPTVKFFRGKEAIMQLYEAVMKEQKFYAVFNPSVVKPLMPKYYEKVAETLREKGGSAKELLVLCPDAEAYQKKFTSEHHQIKLLSPAVRFASDTILCAEKIFMVSYDKKELFATEIVNHTLAQTQLSLFELLWACIP